MTKTRGNLEPARIYEVDEKGREIETGLCVSCMFNPYEYTISKTNTFCEKPKNDADTPHSEFSQADAQTLQLSLMFDTYEKGDDVSQETRKLWKLMMIKTQKARKGASPGRKVPPPQVAFEWGVFRFISYITSMTQRFTLFKPNGTPVRAKVNVTFKGYTDVEDHGPQNPTSGGGPIERVWRVLAGDRLDTIAAEVYDDATKWRLIAQHNRIFDPLALRPGQELRIPID